MPDEIPATPPTPTFNFSKLPDFKTLYVNWIQTSFTPFDISVLVGQASNVEPNTADIEQKARLIFHPAEAKILSGLISQTVKLYEAQYGEIDVDNVKHTLKTKAEKSQSEGV